MVSFGHTHQQAVPCIVDLMVGQLGISGDFPDVFPEIFGAYIASFKIGKYWVLYFMTVKVIGIINAQGLPGLLALQKIKAENYIAIVKDDVFDVLHWRINLRQICTIQYELRKISKFISV